MTPKQFVDKKLGEKGYTHSPYSMYREEIYDWLNEYEALNESSVISPIMSAKRTLEAFGKSIGYGSEPWMTLDQLDKDIEAFLASNAT